MSPNTRAEIQRHSGRSAEVCLEMICRGHQIGMDPAMRASREAARILNRWGVNLDPSLTISEQAEAARQRGEVWGVALCTLLDQMDKGHCARQPLIGARAGSMDGYVLQRGLTERMVKMLDQLAAVVGSPDPRGRIISGYRSPSEQATLRSRWDSGDRVGLVCRPADPRTSRHCTGTAVDFRGSNSELIQWGHAWIRLGGRWGGKFFPKPDPVHFDLG